MPKTVSSTKSSTSKAKAPSKSNSTQSSQTDLNQYLKDEIARLSETQGISAKLLEEFAYFVIENHKKKSPRIKPLTTTQLKQAVYQHFGVKTTAELKKSGSFKMATDGMEPINLSGKEGWEKLYRKFIGILPGEEDQQGYGCINGINVFNYFKPWQVFGLDPATATPDAIKKAYHNLSRIYHPDGSNGDTQIFERITIMYKSISAEA